MIRDTWYYKDANGRLVSTLFLTADEYALRPDKQRLSRDLPTDPPPPPQESELDFWKSSALRAINISRLAEINEPILVGSILIDGDAVARESVATKRREIDDCEACGEDVGPCVWRDAMNVTHTFELAAYKLWLRDAAIAISRRATRILAESWDRKAAIEAASTAEEVRSIMSTNAPSEEL